MARGWESKSVEEAQQEMLEARAQSKAQSELSAARREIDRKRAGFELQRTRVMRELENCRHDGVRKTLEDGLAYLNSQIDAIEQTKLEE
jgi:hypothetical protein